jgi:hypothetical protein
MIDTAVEFKTCHIPRISHEELYSVLRNGVNTRQVAVVDVRDDDRAGGHIIASFHRPSKRFIPRLKTLVVELKPAAKVIFHCAQSIGRGPNCALSYINWREKTFGLNSVADPPTWDNWWTNRARREDGAIIRQEIYILTGGYIEWKAQ